MTTSFWKTSRQAIPLDRPVVMGVLNVTPDSFSDGGRFATRDEAVRQAEKMLADGTDVIDIGGESTRPGSSRVTASEEIARVVPVIQDIAKISDIAISIDTTKYDVAAAALGAGASIINDISGLRWEPRLADLAAKTGAGLVLMHSRGEFETMHSQPPVDDILSEVRTGLRCSIDVATERGVSKDQLVLDIGIGFGKTLEQNLELLREVARIVEEFVEFPILVGTSRKSFIGKLTSEPDAANRLGGSLATALLALHEGAKIIRVHDVKETVQAIQVLRAIMGS